MYLIQPKSFSNFCSTFKMDWNYLKQVYDAITSSFTDKVVLTGSGAINAYLYDGGYQAFTINDLDFIAMVNYANAVLPDEFEVNGEIFRMKSGQSRLTNSKTYVSDTFSFDLSKFKIDNYEYSEIDGIKILSLQRLKQDYSEEVENTFAWNQKFMVSPECESEGMEKMYRQNLELKVSVLDMLAKNTNYSVYSYNVNELDRRSRRHFVPEPEYTEYTGYSPPYDPESRSYPQDSVSRVLSWDD